MPHVYLLYEQNTVGEATTVMFPEFGLLDLGHVWDHWANWAWDPLAQLGPGPIWPIRLFWGMGQANLVHWPDVGPGSIWLNLRLDPNLTPNIKYKNLMRRLGRTAGYVFHV